MSRQTQIFIDQTEYQIWKEANCDRCKSADSCIWQIEIEDGIECLSGAVSVSAYLADVIGYEQSGEWNCFDLEATK